MHLLNYSLLKSSSITCAAVGSFSGTKAQEICVARGGTRIELLRTDAQTGKLESVAESEVFGTIRSLAAFKLTGGSKGTFASQLRGSVDLLHRKGRGRVASSMLTDSLLLSLFVRRLHYSRLRLGSHSRPRV